MSVLQTLAIITQHVLMSRMDSLADVTVYGPGGFAMSLMMVNK